MMDAFGVRNGPNIELPPFQSQRVGKSRGMCNATPSRYVMHATFGQRRAGLPKSRRHRPLHPTKAPTPTRPKKEAPTGCLPNKKQQTPPKTKHFPQVGDVALPVLVARVAPVAPVAPLRAPAPGARRPAAGPRRRRSLERGRRDVRRFGSPVLQKKAVASVSSEKEKTKTKTRQGQKKGGVVWLRAKKQLEPHMTHML